MPRGSLFAGTEHRIGLNSWPVSGRSQPLRAWISVLATIWLGLGGSCHLSKNGRAGDGPVRSGPPPFLGMPRRDAEAFPPLLSQTGAFADVRQLKPRAGLIHYDLNVAFWSDGASKDRWISVPAGARIAFSPDG